MVIIFLKKFINFVDNIIYFVLYYFLYKFSGAHNKPKTDTKYDPTLQHQNNVFYKMVRFYENLKTKSLILQHSSKNISSSAKYPNPDPINVPFCDQNNGLNSIPPETLQTLPLQSMQLDSDNKINKKIFLEKTSGKRIPIVIKNLIRDCDARNKWSPSFFKDNYGSTKLLTLSKENTNKKAYTSFTQKLDCQYITLEQSISNMLQTENTNNVLYINNITEIFSKHPELIKDLNLNNISKIDESINEDTWLKVNLFMGGSGTGSSLHCAVAGNFFFNVYGKKKWILIDPMYTKYLKSTPSENFGFVISGYDIENIEQLGKLNEIIPKYEIVLEPGDVLYVPPWWWHYVHNETDFTIGCAVRDHTIYYQSIYNNPMFMLMSPYIYKLNPLFLKIVEFFKGRNYMLKKSMESDKYIMKHLTGNAFD
jgi:hypothetical protein